MAEDTRQLPADKAMATVVASLVQEGVAHLVHVANERKAEILGELRNTTVKLNNANDEIGRLTTELNGRPTSEQLEAAREQARQAQTRIDTLQQQLGEIERELSTRPSSPEQIEGLLRDTTGPIFAEAVTELRK